MNPFFRYRFELTREGRAFDVLLLFLSSAGFDESAFGDIMEEEVGAALRPDAVLLVVRNASFDAVKNVLLTSAVAEAGRRRVEPTSSFEVLGYGPDGDEMRREHIGGPRPEVRVECSDLRRRGVTEIFTRRGGFVESTPAFHFENPSKRHTERFMRLSNILVRGAEIGFIAFATLPFVPLSASIAYVDTPAVFAVVAAINEQRASLGWPPLLADSFGSYQGYTKYAFTRQREAVVIISASSSTSLAKRLTEEKEFEADAVVHLLFLGRSDPPRKLVCNLAADAVENPNGVARFPSVQPREVCSICATGSIAIKLSGDQFDISGPQPEPLLITRDHAPKELSQKMARLGGRKILGIVPGADGKHDHRLLDVSEEALLGSESFMMRMDYALRRSLPAAISHVVQVGARSKSFAEKICAIAERAGRSTLLVEPDRLDQIVEDSNTSIVVVATSIESGRSLLDISRDLRSIAENAPIFYLVGLEKTTGLAGRSRLESTLSATKGTFKNAFLAVESFTLPPSDAQNSWRSELDLLRSPEVSSRIPPELQHFFSARELMLRRGDAPVFDDIFLANRPGRQLILQPGFVFWPEKLTQPGNHSQADVLFTVASILQHLRASAIEPGRAALKSSPFQQTLLAAENFGRFNDDVIQAAILRSATARELNFQADEGASAQAARLIRRILQSVDKPRGGAAAEFLLAMACRRLSLLPADREAVLQVSIDPGSAPVVAFLADLCRMQPNS